MLLVGSLGASLVVLGLAQKYGLDINEDLIKIFMECAKYGAILWLMKVFSGVFL